MSRGIPLRRRCTGRLWSWRPAEHPACRRDGRKCRRRGGPYSSDSCRPAGGICPPASGCTCCKTRRRRTPSPARDPATLPRTTRPRVRSSPTLPGRDEVSAAATLPLSDTWSGCNRISSSPRAETRRACCDRGSDRERRGYRDGDQPWLKIECLLFPDVNVTDSEKNDEDEHLAEEEHALGAGGRLAVDDGPRVEERRLDVEKDEQHGDLVEADVDTLPVLIERRDPALVRLLFRGGTGVPTDEPGQRKHHDADDDGDEHHDQDGKECVGHERQ